MVVDFKRLASLSNVAYEEPVKLKKKVKKTVRKEIDLMETDDYKGKIKETVLYLLENAEKDGQVTFRTQKKEKIVINNKEYSSKNIKGIITLIIDKEDIKETDFSPEEIAYELKNNKDFYKKDINISDVVDGENEEIDECYVNIKNDNVVLKIYYSSEKEKIENNPY